MPNYGSKDLLIELKDGGGTYRDITNQVRKMGDFEVAALLEDSHGFGKAWKEFIYTGFNECKAFALEGLYNDDATVTPYALWAIGASRLFRVTWGGGHTSTCTVIMQSWV